MRKPIHLPLGRGVWCSWWIALSFPCLQLAAQPCPSIINCPQSTPTFCDESANDMSLWNNPPYTYSATIGDGNLHEGGIDLNIKVKGCNGGGLVTISYLLYLDLDNDGLQETVVMSGTPPPAGIVRANNSFNPGYAGGDTVQFDQRALPDSMRYRFGLEIAYSGDTTTGWVRFFSDHAPFDFTPVILPEGRHRIEWRIAQDGVERFCDRNFKVKDCKKPLVSCKSGLAVYLDIFQTASITLLQALQSTSDNITPDTQLVLGMRRLGTGTGFPLDAMGNPQDTAMFSCFNAENQFIELWARDKAGNLENCTAQVLVYDTSGICPFAPTPTICAATYWDEQTIRDVSFSTSWTVPGQPPFRHPLAIVQNSCAELSPLPPTSLFTLTASKDTFPLNGVTTYDLVLISKHILGTDPFDAGWKIMAADANKSNSVTTFDIVELRKLILGLSTKLPAGNTSWRFFVDTCTVWGSPYYGNCPSAYSLPVQPLSAYPPHLSFKGLKVGDVNGSASAVDTLQGPATARGSIGELELPDLRLNAGEALDVPLRVAQTCSWEGFQFSLSYDAAALDVQQLLPADAPAFGPDNWAVPSEGLLNVSWSAPEPSLLLPKDALCYLRLKARRPLTLSEVIYPAINNTSLQAEAYDDNGTNHPLQIRFSAGRAGLSSGGVRVFAPIPNPTGSSAQLPIRLEGTEAVTIELSDFSGKTLWRQTKMMDAGAHLLEIPASALPEAGLYGWRVYAGQLVQSGKLVRI